MNQMMGQISPKHNDKQGSLLINSKNGDSSSNPIDADSNQQPVPFIQPFSVGGPGRFSLRSSDHWSPQLHQIMNNNQSSSSNVSSGSSKQSSNQQSSMKKFSGGSFGLVLRHPSKGQQTPSFQDQHEAQVPCDVVDYEMAAVESDNRMSFSPRGSIIDVTKQVPQD